MELLEPETNNVLDITDDSDKIAFAEPDENVQTLEYSLPSFDVFQMSVEEKSLDTTLLLQKLNDLQNEHVDKNVLEIFKLKYIENHSVEKVSEILEISSDDVMDVLVYIVDLVRNL